nr:TM2 domain-containing protein [uncultured Alistipes sp.]
MSPTLTLNSLNLCFAIIAAQRSTTRLSYASSAGVPLPPPRKNPADKSSKDWIVTLLLCFFLGGFGVHRFYVGKVGTGILQLITLGACGVWTLVDFIMIALGNFTDADGKRILNDR